MSTSAYETVLSYTYKTSALLNLAMFSRICIGGDIPSWYDCKGQQLRLWQLYGVAHVPLTICAYICSTATCEFNGKQIIALKFGVCSYTLMSFIYMLPLRKNDANGFEKVIGSILGILSVIMIADVIRCLFP